MPARVRSRERSSHALFANEGLCVSRDGAPSAFTIGSASLHALVRRWSQRDDQDKAAVAMLESQAGRQAKWTALCDGGHACTVSDERNLR